MYSTVLHTRTHTYEYMSDVCILLFVHRTHSSTYDYYVLGIKTKTECDGKANALEQQQKRQQRTACVERRLAVSG